MKRTTIIVAGVSLGLMAHQSNADIVGVSGSGSLISPPMSLEVGEVDSATTVFAINERQGLILPYDLSVDATGPGFFDSMASLNGGVISAGTPLSSHLVHMDTDLDVHGLMEATFTFDFPILGIIVTRSGLNASDVDLGFATTLYPLSDYRGPELNALDRIRLNDDGHSIWVNLQQTTEVDEIRVITAAPPVPVPGSLAAIGLAGVLGGRRRR
jgi:hypothetical protein